VAIWNQRVTVQGKTFTRRTAAMLRNITKLTGLPLVIAQGSYNAGGVAVSGGTHDREAADLSVRGYTDVQRRAVVRAAKLSGFAAWYRPPLAGVWGEHIHMIPIKGDLSGSAAAQVIAFDAGRDGLRGNRQDLTYRPDPRVRWSYPLRRTVRR